MICVDIHAVIFREAETNELHRYEVFDHYDKSVSQSFAVDAGGSQRACSNINAHRIGSQKFRKVNMSH